MNSEIKELLANKKRADQVNVFMELLADESNIMGSACPEIVQDLFNSMHKQHRTLQQGIIRILIGFLKKYGETPLNRQDPRNQYGIDLCKKISEIEHYLPTI